MIRLGDGNAEQVNHEIIWHGHSATGEGVSSGIYIARLATPEYSKSIKMVLLN